MQIRVLSAEVINQIAAGEVVDRPAQVVRELVDNSIDAGADEIRIYIVSGGQTSIKVLDNGCGMERDDAVLAFERHATSKVKSVADLNAIQTLGFRGEALPSIAAVARVRLRTRMATSETGSEVVIEGGKLKDVQTVSCTPGTEVEVRHLYFNTPARRKFLKSVRAEELRIKQWVLHAALSYPGVHYRLFAEERELVNLPKRGSVLERAAGIFKGSTIAFEQTVGPCHITGLLGHPAQAQADCAALVVLVNNRLVNDRLVLKAVKDGFSSTLREREFPLGFVSIKLPATEVDVNVHPQKSEVRFRAPQAVFLAVRNAVSQAVRQFKGPAPAFPRPLCEAAGERRAGSTGKQAFLWDNAASAGKVSLPGMGHAALPVEGECFSFSNLRYIGQVFSCYLLCEYNSTLYVIDMHAAHERINYNLLREALKTKTIPSQRLLLGSEIRVGETGLFNLEGYKESLKLFGFEFESRPPESVLVQAVPGILSGRDIGPLIREIAAMPVDGSAQGAIQERYDYFAARIACHASVRSGQELSSAEVYALLSALEAAEFGAACPHGRPVMVAFSEKEVEKWFGRDR